MHMILIIYHLDILMPLELMKGIGEDHNPETHLIHWFWILFLKEGEYKYLWK